MIRCLIIEDTPFVAEILRFHLKEMKIDVLPLATTVNEGLEIFEIHQPELVLLDLVLPERNGLFFAKEIMPLNPHVKIIAISSLNKTSLLNELIDSGCSDFLVKPFTKKILEEKIKKALEDLNSHAFQKKIISQT